MKRPPTLSQGRYWPAFESDLLQDVAELIRKRSKSLKHHVADYSCERVVEAAGDERCEKLELRFELYGDDPFRISLSLWADRWLWIDVRNVAKESQAVEWRHEGRVGAAYPGDIANALLESVGLPFDGGSADYCNAKLSELWLPIAVTGPAGIVYRAPLLD